MSDSTPTPESPVVDPTPTIIVTTLFGSKLIYRGPGVLPGMVDVETDEGCRTCVLVADLKPESIALIPS